MFRNFLVDLATHIFTHFNKLFLLGLGRNVDAEDLVVKVSDLNSIGQPFRLFNSLFDFHSPLSFNPTRVDILKNLFVLFVIQFCILSRIHIVIALLLSILFDLSHSGLHLSRFLLDLHLLLTQLQDSLQFFLLSSCPLFVGLGLVSIREDSLVSHPGRHWVFVGRIDSIIEKFLLLLFFGDISGSFFLFNFVTFDQKIGKSDSFRFLTAVVNFNSDFCRLKFPVNALLANQQNDLQCLFDIMSNAFQYQILLSHQLKDNFVPNKWFHFNKFDDRFLFEFDLEAETFWDLIHKKSGGVFLVDAVYLALARLILVLVHDEVVDALPAH